MQRREVIKHSSAIQITNTIGLLQRRAWNILLATAYDFLMEQDEHEIKVGDLMDQLGIKSKNYEYLKTLLSTLQTTSVQWNFLDKDGVEKWGSYPLLGGIEIFNGKCVYAFDPLLRKRLHNPRIYARINLSIQNKFDSKHALALYELCIDYFDLTRLEGETSFIDIDKFRKLMGLLDNQYSSFKSLNQWVIKPALEEINSKSDIRIKVDFLKEKRSVIAIKFKIKPNTSTGKQPILPKNTIEKFIDSQDADPFEQWYNGLKSKDRESFRQVAISRLTKSEREAYLSEEGTNWVLESEIQRILRVIWKDV